MSRFVRAALVTVLVLFVAVTPLSAIFRPAYFDAAMYRDDGSFHVVLEDRTGLVAAMGPGDDSASTPRALHVRLDGACGAWHYYLTLYASSDGYTLDRRRTSGSCSLLYLAAQDVVIALRAPIDPASVRIVDNG